MSEDKHPGVMAVEAHESFLQHVESGGSKIRLLSVLTIVVASLLTIAYLAQILVIPFLLGVKTVSVSLVDPGLFATEVGLLVLTLAWLYVGVRDYRFTSKLVKQIEDIRRLQKQIETKIGGS